MSENPSNFEFRQRAFPKEIKLEKTDPALYDENQKVIGNVEFYSNESETEIAMIIHVPESETKTLLTLADVQKMEQTMEIAAQEILSRYKKAKIHLLEFILIPSIEVQVEMVKTLFSFQYSYIKGVTVPVFNSEVKLLGALGSLSRILNISPSRGIKEGQEEFTKKLTHLLQ